MYSSSSLIFQCYCVPPVYKKHKFAQFFFLRYLKLLNLKLIKAIVI